MFRDSVFLGASDEPEQTEHGVEQTEGLCPLIFAYPVPYGGLQDGFLRSDTDPPEYHSRYHHARGPEEYKGSGEYLDDEKARQGFQSKAIVE